MKLIKVLFACFALVGATSASADRIYDLEIETRVTAVGMRFDDTATGVLTLFDDRSYLLDWDGVESVGFWLQEKNNLQLFEDSPGTFADYVASLEEDASSAAGFSVMLTSLTTKETGRFDRNGNLAIRSKQTLLFRPGLQGNSPIKVVWTAKVKGTLR